MTFERYTALLDELPSTPRGLLVPGRRRGEMRVVRPPPFREFRTRQTTPRLDARRNRLAILTWTLEREERRRDAAAYNAAATADLLTEIRSRDLAEMAARMEEDE